MRKKKVTNTLNFHQNNRLITFFGLLLAEQSINWFQLFLYLGKFSNPSKKVNAKIMKKHIILIGAIASFSLHTFAQNGKVTSGAIAYDGGRIEEAIEKLEEALSQKEDLKEKNIPKAHYYLSSAYLAAAQDTVLASQYDDPVEQAYMHYELAKETDTNGKYEKTIVLLEQNLWSSVFSEGVNAYNNDEYKASETLFQKATALNPEDYTSALMLGFSNWMLQDSTKALETLQKTIDLYKASNPEEPVEQVVQAYLMVATIQSSRGETEAALKTLSDGQELFPASQDLKNTELSIYQRNPALAEEALAKFEKAVQEDPDNVTLKLAYADMLYKSGDEEKAMNMFKEILEKDPDNLNANIQLGANYINRAVQLSKKRSELTKEEDINKAQEQIIEVMKKAEPYMKKLHELEPSEPEWINQLVSIAYYLEYPEEEIAELEKKASEINAQRNQ